MTRHPYTFVISLGPNLCLPYIMFLPSSSHSTQSKLMTFHVTLIILPLLYVHFPLTKFTTLAKIILLDFQAQIKQCSALLCFLTEFNSFKVHPWHFIDKRSMHTHVHVFLVVSVSWREVYMLYNWMMKCAFVSPIQEWDVNING